MAYNITMKTEAIELRRMQAAARIIEDMPEALAKQMLHRMQLAVVMAKLFCPVGERLQPDGIKLIDTIEVLDWDPDPENPMVAGGSLLPRAGYPEFGTVKQRAKPFWRPAVWQEWFNLQRDMEKYQRQIK